MPWLPLFSDGFTQAPGKTMIGTKMAAEPMTSRQRPRDVWSAAPARASCLLCVQRTICPERDDKNLTQR
ncbi:hypothetical protein E2C01_075181 [Portunus trituberculatus]|uniref:Uncharacterized protein n=1 Tax=Portunus trituberculatus TaxID=210409 RepID=A0A5B7IIG2_PORTR|nr:hypothetical protein [Portunus trituberculatus]